MTNKTKQSTPKKSGRMLRKAQRLEQLLARYKQTKSVQYALLQLSELASNVTDLAVFYSAMHQVIDKLLHAENFYVVLADPQTHCLHPVYFFDQFEECQLSQLDCRQFEQGLTGHVFRTGESLLCDPKDIAELVAQGAVQAYGAASSHWMGIPLKREQQIIGVVVLQTYDNTRYSESDQALMEFVSRHLVTAIDRVNYRDRLEQSVRDRTLELSQLNCDLQIEIKERQRAELLQNALFKISQITATAVLMDEFYCSIHQVLASLIYAENCYIALLSDNGTQITFPFYIDVKKTIAKPRPFSGGLTEYVITQGQACLIDRVQAQHMVQSGLIFRRQQDQHGLNDFATAWLGAPLIIEDRVIGVVATQAYNDAHQYTDRDLEVLRFVSHHLAVAIQRKLDSDRLRNSYDELEDKILSRTQELRQTNLFLKLQIEERKKAEQKLYFEANHDALTGLPNRKMLLQRLEQAISHKKRHLDHHFAVLFIDLDRFKVINDTMGHQVGDQFLMEVSSRIGDCIRENDILARFGGDEFVILLDMINSIDDAEEIAQRIIVALAAPFCMKDQEVYSGASVGITDCKPTYRSADEVLRDADAAMYQAKNMGRGRFIVFDETIHQQLIEDLSIDQALHRAVKERALFPRYLSLHNVQTAQPLGVEVVTYWQHPELGAVEQSYFDQLAQTNGLIKDIDQQILTQVCQAMQVGGDLAEAALVTIRLSASHLDQGKSLQQLLDIVKNAAIDCHKLCFEFAEHTLLKHQGVQLAGFKRIKNAGISIAIQGFGGGVSSLGLFTQNAIDYVKVDRDLTRVLPNNAKNQALLATLMTLSVPFGFKVILDGIDNEQLQQLAVQHQVFIGQGQWFNAPMMAVGVEAEAQVDQQIKLA